VLHTREHLKFEFFLPGLISYKKGEFHHDHKGHPISGQ
jgi:hypothetical protein